MDRAHRLLPLCPRQREGLFADAEFQARLVAQAEAADPGRTPIETLGTADEVYVYRSREFPLRRVRVIAAGPAPAERDLIKLANIDEFACESPTWSCRRWPTTANSRSIVSRHTAMDTRPVSGLWITEALPARTATPERPRVDRNWRKVDRNWRKLVPTAPTRSPWERGVS